MKALVINQHVSHPSKNDKVLVVGLGNPTYTNTYHNVGADLLIEYIKQNSIIKLKSNIWQMNNVIFCVCPDYMNISGPAITKIYRRYKCTRLIILVDELDLPPGKLKYQNTMFAKGHNGIRSMIEEKIPFSRILIGIGRPEHMAIKDYVLSKCTLEYNALLYGSALIQLTSILNELLN